MTFDLSRVTFDSRKDFLGVIMQQGRVQLDADWNEWVAELTRRLQAGTLDTFSGAVVPQTTPNGFLIQIDGSDLSIGTGRIYVDGLLAENHGSTPDHWEPHLAELAGTGSVKYSNQPYYRDPPDLPAAPGPHLVYVDVWQRDVTHLQAPDLIEKAVGVDTTGRRQTIWQVKVLKDFKTCPEDNDPRWRKVTAPSPARLSTDTGEPETQEDPCKVPPAAGYRGLENQLYRVEVHKGGPFGTATFKWSRDNGTVASRVTHINADGEQITVESVGRDDFLRFRDGDWVEVTDDWLEWKNDPGELRRIKSDGGVDMSTRTLTLDKPLTVGLFPTDAQQATVGDRNVRVRRWDQSGKVFHEGDETPVQDLNDANSEGDIDIPASGTRLFLEHGILVEFSLEPEFLESGELVDNPPERQFRTGDYWVFAARSTDGSIDILKEAPPLGVHHHYAPLAIVDFSQDNEDPTSCRTLWPPLPEKDSCDCTVCVVPEGPDKDSHNLQNAINKVQDIGGGTVCLSAGTYQLTEPVQMDMAKSLRIRGQGWATVLAREEQGTVLEVSNAQGVALENLSVVGTAAQDDTTTAVISASNVADFRMDHVNVVGNSRAGATAVGLKLSGVIEGGSVRDCAFVATQGIAGPALRDGSLLTSGLRIEDNAFFCSARGLSFEGTSLHFGACALERNLIRGCSDGAVVVTGDVLPGSTVSVSSNNIYAERDGIRAGTDGLRIETNEITGSGKAGSGIVVERGLDPLAIDHAQIIGNRIRDMGGHGIAIRHRLGAGMIKQNVVEHVAGGAVVIEGGGAADYLVIANNHFLDLGNAFDNELAAVQLIDVSQADILDNVFAGVGHRAQKSPFITGILAIGVEELRAAGNRMHDIGSDAQELAAAIQLWAPFRHAAIQDNVISRLTARKSPWHALRIHGGFDRNREALRTPAPNVLYVRESSSEFVVTTNRLVRRQVKQVSASVRGNRFGSEAIKTAELVLADGLETCLFTENRCQTGPWDGEEIVDVALNSLLLNASNNQLIGHERGLPTLSIKSRHAVVIGNISTGSIEVNGAVIPSGKVGLDTSHEHLNVRVE